MTMHDFEFLTERVAQWCGKHGLNGDTGFLLKLVEEVGELAGCHVKDKPQAELESEAADVLICLIAYANVRGIDLVSVAHDKMAVNEARKGKPNRFGVFVKEADLS